MECKTRTFSIDYTNYAKGIGILLLLVHHFIFVRFHIPFQSGDLHELVVLFGKVCVPLFALLSGYGITKSYNKNAEKSGVSDGRFIFNHLKKLLINYWWVYIPTLLLAFITGFRGYPQEVYGTGLRGVLNFLLDFTGMRAVLYSPTYCNTWWFIEATLVFYALFPVIYNAYKKASFLTMGVLALPPLLRLFIRFPAPFSTTDREIYYLFAFAAGMVLADRGLADKAVALCQRDKLKYTLALAICLPLSMAAAMYINLFGMLLFAITIIAVVILLKSLKYSCGRLMEFLGKYSMNVFLIHSLYMALVKQHLVFDALPTYANMIIQFVFILVSAFTMSFLLELFKKRIGHVFSKSEKRV